MTDREPVDVAQALEALRPDLHRYCARMTGSVFDGEDIVQETLLEALRSAPHDDPARLRPWVFRTANNRMIDRWRAYDRRMRDPFDAVAGAGVADAAPRADEQLVQQEAVHAALAHFVALPPLQRCAVILKDVLGHSLEDIAALLERSVVAVQGALHRGRTALHEQLAAGGADAAASAPRPEVAPVLRRYAALFDARDWAGVRALLADDVRLHVFDKARVQGRREVESYFGRYDRIAGWSAVVAVVEGIDCLLVSRPGMAPHPIRIAVVGEGDAARIASIDDYFHVPYLLRESAPA